VAVLTLAFITIFSRGCQKCRTSEEIFSQAENITKFGLFLFIACYFSPSQIALFYFLQDANLTIA
jgi:hypothetical protein